MRWLRHGNVIYTEKLGAGLENAQVPLAWFSSGADRGLPVNDVAVGMGTVAVLGAVISTGTTDRRQGAQAARARLWRCSTQLHRCIVAYIGGHYIGGIGEPGSREDAKFAKLRHCDPDERRNISSNTCRDSIAHDNFEIVVDVSYSITGGRGCLLASGWLTGTLM